MFFGGSIPNMLFCKNGLDSYSFLQTSNILLSLFFLFVFFSIGALAIGITCNFVNNNTIEEARVNEISGISFQYNQKFFIQMEEKYGVRLENIVYYKDETHYFVMTALKNSLLKLKVLKEVINWAFL